MPNEEQLQLVYENLKAILCLPDASLRVGEEEPGKITVLGPYIESMGKDFYFGMVKINKRYVSYHFMPVYMYPDLLDDISADLRKHMQGKSCFNFTRVEDGLFLQLAILTFSGLSRLYRLGIFGE
jgi:hypothetical protein